MKITCVLSAARLAADEYVYYYIRELTKMKEDHDFIFMAKHETPPSCGEAAHLIHFSDTFVRQPPSCGEAAPMDVVLCYVS